MYMDFKSYLRENLSEERYLHSLGTQKAAVELAERFSGDVEKAAFAGLVHDIAKELPKARLYELAEVYGLQLDEVEKASPGLLHGPVGAEILRHEYGVADEEILLSIKNHTTGAANMSKLEKIIYLADLIEENREFDGMILLREYAMKSLDQAIVFAMKCSIKHLLKKEILIHKSTVEAYNYLIMEKENGY